MNSNKVKIWDIYRELIISVNGLVALSIIFRVNRNPENIPADFREYSQSIRNMSKKYGESISGDLREWFHKHSQTFEDWSKKLGEMSYSDMAGLTEEQQRQKMIDALQRFESVMGEGNNLAKDYVFEGKEDFFPGGISSWFSNIYEYSKKLQGL